MERKAWMPSSEKNNDISFSDKIMTAGNDSFNLNYIYFDEDDHKVKQICGTLKTPRVVRDPRIKKRRC